MNEQNPYAAPQGTVNSCRGWLTSDEVDLGDMPEGATACLRAVYFFAFDVGAILLSSQIPIGGLGAVLIITILLTAILCHAIGLYQLGTIDPRANATGLMQIALVCFGLSVASEIVSIGWLVNTKSELPFGVQLAIRLLGMISSVCMLLGLCRIGRQLQHDKVVWNAKVALGVFALLYGSSMILLILVQLPDWSKEIELLLLDEDQALVITGIIVLAITLGGLGCYCRALLLLRRYGKVQSAN